MDKYPDPPDAYGRIPSSAPRAGLFYLRVIAGLQIDPERSYVPKKQASRSAGAELIRQ